CLLLLAWAVLFLAHRPSSSAPPSLHDALPIYVVACSLPYHLCVSGGSLHSLRAGTSGAPPATGVAVHARGRSHFLDHRCPFHARSEEHTSDLQSRENLVCRLLLEKKKHPTNPF